MNRPPEINPKPAIAPAALPPGDRPPLTPRAITPHVLARSWMEPRVRCWWLCSAALVVIGIIFLIQQLVSYRNETRLIRNGKTVTAEVYEVQGGHIRGQKSPPHTPCMVRFSWNGETVSAPAVLAGDDYVVTDMSVTLHVNPNNPTDFTDLSSPESFFRGVIAGGVVILPVLAGTAAAAWYARRQALNTWRDGITDIYAVIDARNTALAPHSHSVRCIRADGTDLRIVTVYVPNHVADPREGDLLWLVHPRNNPRAALAVIVYV